jgi:alkylation response protein AidB-like acyl-CoA dehydrogenase
LGNLPLLGVFLGIAEHAYELALAAATGTQKKGKPRSAELPGIQHMIAEIEILLATARAMVGQMGSIADDFLEEFDGKKIPIERAHELLKDHQSMKWVVNRNAIEIVNRAMDIVGGGGFMDKHPLSRLYRDVRAGPFMQPYSPTEARDYIGKVALGIYPEK